MYSPASSASLLAQSADGDFAVDLGQAAIYHQGNPGFT